MDNEITADVVCLDFSRAFDPICLCDKDVLSDGKNLLTVRCRRRQGSRVGYLRGL